MKDSRFSPLEEAWILFFILGVVMINYPFTHIFNKVTTFMGIPLMVFYFLVGWPLSILVIYLFARNIKNSETTEGDLDSDGEGS
ncbi:hypothetical protein [Desulfurispira natronophila]|uniref:DUF3311 domain-containing protein n=1 Tax=Desulfurispira natronophila TaxID=682562 RepID=A0A7W7Y2Q3_9BACT|nr:hypothetical protein [Desulfurispira natronophila]MBB5021005.1 hypothetical protein [Desulfurispira natronophila]